MAETKTKLELDLEKRLIKLEEKKIELKEERFNLENTIIDKRTKAYKDAKKANTEDQRDTARAIAAEKKRGEILEDTKKKASGAADQAKKIGDSIESFVAGMPGGGFLVQALGLDGLGDKMKTALIDKLQAATLSTGKLGAAMKFAMGPLGIAVATLAVIVTLVRRVRARARELAGELGTSAKFAKEQLISLKAQEASLKIQNFDSKNLQTTFKGIVDTFGSLENATAANAANLEKLSQSTGTSSSDIIKFNKVMMDLTGASFDVATNMAETAISMAESANVSTNKVMSDIASNAERFAEMSMDGAQGLAQAAVEAAKVGSSLNGVLEAADKLLEFESSITAQFKAQVLTGKQINTERARQLALDGDIAGLTNEIQSIVGQVGDIQTLNVIQRQSVADAIGISVQDLLRISRGEQAQQQETVQDKVDTTNKILLEGLDVDKKILEATEDKNVNIIQPAF